MTKIAGKRGMIPALRKLIRAGKSDAAITRYASARWEGFNAWELRYARRSMPKQKREQAARKASAA